MASVRLQAEKLEDIPEDIREHVTETEDGGFEYDPSPLTSTIKNQRKLERTLKSQIDELEKKLKQPGQPPKVEEDPAPAPKQEQESAEIAEMRKQIQALQESAKRSEQEKEQLSTQNFLSSLERDADMNDGAARLIQDQISKDEKGFFIRDTDGSPLLDSLGNRVDPVTYVKSLKTSKSWLFKSQGSGTNGAGYGQPPTLSPQQAQMAKEWKKSQESGDLKQQFKLLAKAQRRAG